MYGVGMALSSFVLLSLLFLIAYTHGQTYEQQQSTGSSGLHDVKITSHYEGQQVPAGNLTISGNSTDTPQTKCEVYAQKNGLLPFERVTAAGSGPEDYSKWTFTYSKPNNYITSGNTNDLTVKLSCLNNPTNLTVFQSINVTGMSSDLKPINNRPTTSPILNNKIVEGQADVGKTITNDSCGPTDMAILLDNSGSMSGALDNIKSTLPKIISLAKLMSQDNLRLGYVTFDNDITIRSELSQNTSKVLSNIKDTVVGDSGHQGLGVLEPAEASDEALNATINNLGTRLRQIGSFSEPWRDSIHKVMVLITDAPPAGLDDRGGQEDIDRMYRLSEMAKDRGMRISTIFVPTAGDHYGQAEILKDVANRSGSAYIMTNTDGTGSDDALLDIIRNCGEPLKYLRFITDFEKDPVDAGKEQKLSVTVYEANSTKTLNGANVTSKIRDGAGQIQKEFSGITDSNGLVSFSWKIPVGSKISTTSTMEANTRVSSYGYATSSNVSSFQIKGTSPSSTLVEHDSSGDGASGDGEGGQHSANDPPKAIAESSDNTPSSGDKITLDGSKSEDQDNDKLYFKWDQTGGLKVNLNDKNSESASFIAPKVSKDEILEFKLTVDDGQSQDTDSLSQWIYSKEDKSPCPQNEEYDQIENICVPIDQNEKNDKHDNKGDNSEESSDQVSNNNDNNKGDNSEESSDQVSNNNDNNKGDNSDNNADNKDSKDSTKSNPIEDTIP
jgi:von Willebrand factor type A domain